LHGILASTELLSDSDLDISQRGLCDTIESCGHTLLNTISQILDYSKINDLNNPPETTHKKGQPVGETKSVETESLSSVGRHSNVDVAWICEAVVQTVCAGFRHDQCAQNPQANDGAAGMLFSSDPKLGFENAVQVILDVSPGEWMFVCAPGAIQRVLMNLVGNSLKYTREGWVSTVLCHGCFIIYEVSRELILGFCR
jgi:signal transduction histidine kinase